jgi:hypothetical protein
MADLIVKSAVKESLDGYNVSSDLSVPRRQAPGATGHGPGVHLHGRFGATGVFEVAGGIVILADGAADRRTGVRAGFGPDRPPQATDTDRPVE